MPPYTLTTPHKPVYPPTHPASPPHPPQVLNQYGDRLDIEHLKDLCGPQMRTLQLGQPPNTHCSRAEFILAMLVRAKFDPNLSSNLLTRNS